MIDWAAAMGALVIVGHDPERPFVRVEVAGDRVQVTDANVST